MFKKNRRGTGITFVSFAPANPFLKKKKKKISCLNIFPLLFWHLPAAKCLPAVCVLDWSSESVPEILARQPAERSVPPAAEKNYHLPKR